MPPAPIRRRGLALALRSEPGSAKPHDATPAFATHLECSLTGGAYPADTVHGLSRAGKEPVGRFDCSTLKEPYRIEGKKTMELGLAEQMGWKPPDIIFYPTGGGTGLIGIWKAFAELRAIGWLPDDAPLPRMVAVQAAGCAPIVRAWEAGEEFAPLWEDACTVAAGFRVPVAVGDDAILAAVDEVARAEGVMLCPEGAATYAAWKRALDEGRIGSGDTAVLFNCATGLKYPMPPAKRSIDRHRAVDWAQFR